jgi:hypothetical protein
MNTHTRVVCRLVLVACIQPALLARQHGTPAMNFDQHKTTHHFALTPDGGRIEVTSNDPRDADTLAAVRMHLRTIAGEFANGNFDKPLATHDEMPPGVRTLQERKGSVSYRYEELPNGGRVVITTSDPEARNAAHDFLRYQIREHKTGDPVTVQKTF